MDNDRLHRNVWEELIMAADLHRKPEQKTLMEIYAPYIVIVCIIILVLLIIAVIFTMTGLHANSLTGTEANTWQNMGGII